jgi:hypothetical protein
MTAQTSRTAFEEIADIDLAAIASRLQQLIDFTRDIEDLKFATSDSLVAGTEVAGGVADLARQITVQVDALYVKYAALKFRK